MAGQPSEDFETTRRRFDALIRRVAIVAVALFITVPIAVKVTNLITKPHLPPGRAHLFHDLPDALAAEHLAASLTVQLRALYPGTVVVSNGEQGKSGTYIFTVHSPERVTVDQLRAVLPVVTCSVKVNDPVACSRRGLVQP